MPKANTENSQNIIEETKSTAKTIEELDERNVHVKTLVLMNENGVIDEKSIRPIAKLLVPSIKSQFQMHHNPDSDNWNDYTMKGEKYNTWR